MIIAMGEMRLNAEIIEPSAFLERGFAQLGPLAALVAPAFHVPHKCSLFLLNSGPSGALAGNRFI
jgi:hypothetical protein